MNKNKNLCYWAVSVVVTSLWAWSVFPSTNQCAVMQMSLSDVTAVKKDPEQKIREKRSELRGIRTSVFEPCAKLRMAG